TQSGHINIVQMHIWLINFVAGLICLPMTFSNTREGIIILSIVIVAVIAGLAAVISAFTSDKLNILKNNVLPVIIGVLASGTAVFTYHDLDYGKSDPKLSVGLFMSIIELILIVVVGLISMLLVLKITQSIHTANKN
ncbi:MAG: hypothetical protein P8X88_05375, partial [Gammaproteobacteria bacterium]